MMQEQKLIYPIIPLRDIVLFPSMITHIFVGREKSIKAIEKSISKDSLIFLAAQQDSLNSSPTTDEIYKVGVVAKILQITKMGDGSVKIVVEGIKRGKILRYLDNDLYLEAEISLIEEKVQKSSAPIEALLRTIIEEFNKYNQLSKEIDPETAAAITKINEPAKLADIIAAHITLKVADKQSIIEITGLKPRLEKILKLIRSEIHLLKLQSEINAKVREETEEAQKKYLLNEQIKAIQKQLGGDDYSKDIDEYKKKVDSLGLSAEAKEKMQSEIKKLGMMNHMSQEATVVRNYIDWVLSLPWGKAHTKKRSLAEAERILNKDHFGLERIKERIIEYLAVSSRTKENKSPIICLLGPPGVGKTSLAKSIAEAMGRKFVKISLGGVHDESEIRGHRRTYIGSMPGKILQSLKKVKYDNSVILLDEIDKLGRDHRGDPTSALLEVLDPEQNNAFLDHYIEMEYDLSKVVFIATSNSYNMPRPLMDRLEIINLSGYTEDEKLNIAKKHLITKQMKLHGLNKKEWKITDAAIKDIINLYTMEAGVRNLERSLAQLMRKSVKKIDAGEVTKVAITPKNLGEYLGVPKYDYTKTEKKGDIGLTTGLAYTEFGGDILHIEAVLIDGKGEIKHTGKLGEVMQESIQAAYSHTRSIASKLKINKKILEGNNIHIHVPEGATPKDGPSAGIAMFTTIVSLLTNKPVRSDVAMTGEITLRGKVLPIGGLKEKLLAALRSGVKTVIIPKKNEKDLQEIPDKVKKALDIKLVNDAEDVLKIALEK